MTFDDYQKLAKLTNVDLNTIKKNECHMQAGVITELAEVMDLYKKKLAYGKEITMLNLVEEIGDVFWYIANELSFRDMMLEGVYFLGDDFKHQKGELLEKEPEWIIDEIGWIIYKITQTWDFEELFVSMLNLCHGFSIDPLECMNANINKLKVRFGDKFSQEKALNRNLDEEKRQLSLDI